MKVFIMDRVLLKILSSLLAVLLISSMLAACQSDRVFTSLNSDKPLFYSSSKKPSSQNSSKAVSEMIAKTDIIEVTKSYDIDARFLLGSFKAETFYDSSSGITMPYRLQLPINYNQNKQYPVLLYLHSAGEVGSDNISQLQLLYPAFSTAGDIMSETIIICPQTPSGWSGGGNGYLDIAKRIVDSVVKKYSADKNRIYVSGISLGGFATWDIIDSYPDYFAASVSVCGGSGGYVSQAIIDTPVWIYHGTADTTVSYNNSLSTYNAIINSGGNKARMITLEGVNHNAGSYAYGDRDMFNWMFEQNKATKQTAEKSKAKAFKIISQNGETVISEDDIVSATITMSSKTNYLIANLTDTANELLKNKYSENPNEIYTVKIGELNVYEFKLKGSVQDKQLRIVQTVNDAVFKIIYKLISNS